MTTQRDVQNMLDLDCYADECRRDRRERIATAMCAALIAGTYNYAAQTNNPALIENSDICELASDALMMADALMKELEKPEVPTRTCGVPGESL